MSGTSGFFAAAPSAWPVRGGDPERDPEAEGCDSTEASLNDREGIADVGSKSSVIVTVASWSSSEYSSVEGPARGMAAKSTRLSRVSSTYNRGGGERIM